MGIRSREQRWPPKNILFAVTEAFTPLTQACAFAAQLGDRQGSASVQSRRNDNLYTGVVRPVFLAAIFRRVAAKQSEEDRNADDERREMVREGA